MRLALLVIGSLVVACSSNEGDGGGGGSSSSGKGGSGASTSGGNTGSSGNPGSGGASGGNTGSGGASGGNTGSSGSAGSSGSGGSGGSGGSSTAWTCPAGPFDADPVPDGAAPTPVAGVPPADNYHENGFQIIEGPVWFEDALYVSQITQIGSPPKSRGIKILGDTVTVPVPLNDIGTNGLAISDTGALLGARHLDGSVSVLDPANAANVTAVVDMHDGARFNCPNDIAVRSDGNLYFSDPNYQAPTPTPQAATRVYRVAPGAATADVVDQSLSNPNGVMLSLDENTLYITHQGGMMQYPVNADGTTGTGTPVNGFGGDGMGMDCAGNIYMTGTTSIIVVSPELAQIDTIQVPDGLNTTNVAFGGPERKTLFITTLGNNAALYQVELNIPGKPY